MEEEDSPGTGKHKVDSGEQLYCPSYYVALSSDNSWYLFTEKWIKTVYKTGLPAVPSVEGGTLPRETLKQLLLREEMMWDKLAKSEYGSLLSMDGSLDTWSWSLNVPVLNSLSDDDEVSTCSLTILGNCCRVLDLTYTELMIQYVYFHHLPSRRNNTYFSEISPRLTSCYVKRFLRKSSFFIFLTIG